MLIGLKMVKSPDGKQLLTTLSNETKQKSLIQNFKTLKNISFIYIFTFFQPANSVVRVITIIASG